MDDLTQFQSKLGEHQVTPPPKAWSKVEKKLERQHSKVSIRRRQLRKFVLGIAACLGVLCVVRINQINSQDHMLPHGQVASWENLEFHESDARVIENIVGLNDAYSALFERRSR